jgi:nitrite reductase/ring-hydroxylating ferredoxin subunit
MDLFGPKSRRAFLKTMLVASGGFAAWLMDAMAKRKAASPESATKTVTVPLAAGDAIRFYDEAIVVTNSGQVMVFSPVCPHLGCHINRVEGNNLVCPCHGSRFDLRGHLQHGPATRGLQPLAFELDRATATVRVAVKS